MSTASPQPKRSRRVTLIGVVEIVLGAVCLPAATCYCVATLFGAWLTSQGFRGLGPYPSLSEEELAQYRLILAGLLIELAVFVLGALYLIGGIGVLARKSRGRKLSLIAAWLASSSATVLFVLVLILAEGDRDLVLIVGLPLLGIFCGFHAWLWRLLRTERFAAEFRSETDNADWLAC